MIVPSIVAGSIFTFSLCLGDYITVQIVGGKTQLIGNLVYANIGAANNLPFAAALATVPVLIMVVLLLAVRRTGALEPVTSVPRRRRRRLRGRERSGSRSSTCRCWWC